MVVTTALTPPTPPRRRHPVRWAAVAVLAAALLAAAVVWYVDRSGECGKGVERTGPYDECIGVTDGSFSFHDSLDAVMAKIRKENERVEKSGEKSVSIAYVEPLTVTPNEEDTKYGLVEELEGAYLAQLRLNDTDLGGQGDQPQVRLLVGNIGLRSAQWKPLTDQLIRMRSDGTNLVAVAGFGQSRGGTLSAVRALRAAGIPMMGATVTADGLADAEKVGFFRVAAPNSDQAAGAVRHLKEQQTKDPGYKVVVVRDRNTDDIYNTSLYTAFRAAATAAGLKVAGGDLEYLSGNDGISNAFSAVAREVCDARPDAVYFAGRGVNLRNFIVAMSAPARRCPVTVLTGDDAVGVYYGRSKGDAEHEQLGRQWTASRVTALYTALGHPELPGHLYPPANDPFPDFRTLYHREFGSAGDNSGLRDGQTILAHDAVWTLGVAIREAAGPGGASVDASSTLQLLLSLRGNNAVQGISGPIDLGSDGNPVNKPMALVRLEPDGEYTFQSVIRP